MMPGGNRPSSNEPEGVGVAARGIASVSSSDADPIAVPQDPQNRFRSGFSVEQERHWAIGTNSTMGASPVVTSHERRAVCRYGRPPGTAGSEDHRACGPAFKALHRHEHGGSIAKMKEHGTAGVTLSMKNLFGVPPYTIYGVGAGVDEPSLVPQGPFRLFHDGGRGPSKSAPQENNPSTPREDTYRVPRIVTDLVSARPIH